MSDPAAKNSSPQTHKDDIAVDRFAAAMKVKLAAARAKGRDGWDDATLCSAEFLADLLVSHLGKGNAGNLEDVANLAMMLHQRGEDPFVLANRFARHADEMRAEGARAIRHLTQGEGWSASDLKAVIDDYVAGLAR
jgi:hypothetical protein|tara:strand:+ start:16450 stop:16857 length:408 start_codon:yes stop_codon:yes gene_type:complete